MKAEADLEPQSVEGISLMKGAVGVTPLPQPAWSLEDLLAKVTDENPNEEVETGPPVGREIW